MVARRSTRIQDNEERQQAEVIRQENLRKEQEAMQAIQGVKGKIVCIQTGGEPRNSSGGGGFWAGILSGEGGFGPWEFSYTDKPKKKTLRGV